MDMQDQKSARLQYYLRTKIRGVKQDFQIHINLKPQKKRRRITRLQLTGNEKKKTQKVEHFMVKYT